MSVKRCVYDLDKAFLCARPIVHCAYILARCLGPLYDERLTRPAAAGPIGTVGIAKAACRFRPDLRERFAADGGRAVGCAAAEVIAAEGDDALKLCVSLRQVEVYLVIAFVLLDDLAVNHDRRAGNESLRLGSVNGMRLKVRQAHRCRRRLGSRGRRRLHRYGRTFRCFLKRLVCRNAAHHDHDNHCNERNKYHYANDCLSRYFLLFHILIHPVLLLFSEMNVVVYMVLTEAVVACAF